MSPSTSPKHRRPRADDKTPGVFIVEGAGSAPVQRVLARWGWKENDKVDSKEFDIKWVTQVRLVQKLMLPKTQLVNHFRGTDILNHKSKMCRYIARCRSCSDLFFPRQYNVYSATGLRSLIHDYTVTQAVVCIKGGQTDSSAYEVALRVLQRQQSKECEDVPLFRCVHECEALLGSEIRCPRKDSKVLKQSIDSSQRAERARAHSTGLRHNKSGEKLSPRHEKACCSLAVLAEPVSKAQAGEEGGNASTACLSSASHAITEDGLASPRSTTVRAALAGFPQRQEALNGPANAWVVKDPCLSRGRSVTVLTGLPSILAHCERSKSCGLDWNCVVQKYVENPLLIPDAVDGAAAKADLRAWVLVLSWNPLVAFAHPQVYFRVATRPYAFQGHGEAETFAHATNCRDIDNRISLDSLFEHFGSAERQLWEDRTWPQLLDGVRATLLAVRDGVLGVDMEFQRAKQATGGAAGPSAFELYGFDFAVDSSWRPWLLEANVSPNMLQACDDPTLTAWAEMATEAMLRIACFYHNKSGDLPSAQELEEMPESPLHSMSSGKFERVFPHPDANADDGRGCKGNCYGAAVARVPRCLVRGLEVSESHGGWRLIFREDSAGADEAAVWRSYTAQEWAPRDSTKAESLSHARVLREWLFPTAHTEVGHDLLPKIAARRTSVPVQQRLAAFPSPERTRRVLLSERSRSTSDWSCQRGIDAGATTRTTG